MPIRLIALDLDGTLIHEGDRLPPANLEALRRAQELGVTIAISTGRPYVSADAIVARLGLHDTPLISYNGALIKMPGGGETLMEAYVPAGLAREVVELCVARRLQLHYYLGEIMYVPKLSKWSRIYCRRASMPATPIGDLRRFDGEAPTKLLICEPSGRIDELLPEMQERFRDRLYVTRSMAEYLEFLSLDASKGRSLVWLAGHCGVDIAETMGIGDQLNDLPLIQTAGIGVAMPSAGEEMKAAADYVAEDPDAGVAEAIGKFVLSEG
jgi:Cof subfamily protein (haloacid dehalogenase superfamily)